MPTDEEMQEKIYQIYYEVLKEQAEVGMLYGRAEDVVLHIEKRRARELRNPSERHEKTGWTSD